MKKIIIACLAFGMVSTSVFGASNAHNQIFRDRISLSSQGDTALIKFVSNGDTKEVKEWSMIAINTDLHFTTAENTTVNDTDMLLLQDSTWVETNRTPKRMEIRIMADNSSGTAYIRGRGQ